MYKLSINNMLWLALMSVVQNKHLPMLESLRNAIRNVSGNRCESDCRSRGHEFDHGPVPYFPGD